MIPIIQEQMAATNSKIVNIYEDEDNAVIVRRGFKHYGSKKKRIDVLVNFEMTVRRGTIYGLLGPSGGGKTSLLSCLVGRKSLDSGEVWVLGGKPGTRGSCLPGKCVGYMPQDLALYAEFTMNDLMNYFGWIYGMSSKSINERSFFLMEMLDLKYKFKKIKNMSGGQRRRVSLAIALMHDPELLVLDEPTVGVDPILRQKIWKHLVDLVKEKNTTVIITTHYIEEARQAHTIGLIRHGRLLAEDNPDVLLHKHKLSSLEDVFLKLSNSQESPGQNQAQNKLQTTSSHGSILKKNWLFQRPIRKSKHDFLKLKSLQMRALIHKNFLTLWRNPGIILFFLGLPVVQIVLFFTTIGGEPNDLLLGVVNDEIPDIASTQKCPFVRGCQFQNLSCRYLHFLDATIVDLKYYDTVEEVRKEVEEGNAWGVIYFNEKFSSAFVSQQVVPSEKNFKLSQIEVHLDTSDQQINFMIQRDLMRSFLLFAKSVLKDCNKSENLIDYPVAIKEPIIGPEKPTFTDFTAPGIIITIIFFLAVGQTAITLINEKLEGMLDRTIVAGVSAPQILLGHIISQFIIMCLQVILVLFFSLEVFAVRCIGSVYLIITLTLLVGVCGMAYGYTISAACDVERTAIEIALGSFYPCIILSGVIWPVEGMHYGLQCLAYCTPLTFATAGIRAVMAKGWGVHKQTVYLGFVGPIAWTTFFLILVFLILKLKRN